MPRVIETFREFADRQNCPYVVTTGGPSARTGLDVQRYLFENGATSDGTNHADPPADGRERLSARREYVRTRLTLEEKEFNAYKARVLAQADMHLQYPYSCPPPPPTAPAALAAGRERIVALRKQLDDLNARLRDPEADRRQRDRRELDAEGHARLARLAAEVREIDPDSPPPPPADPTPDPAPTEARRWTSF